MNQARIKLIFFFTLVFSNGLFAQIQVDEFTDMPPLVDFSYFKSTEVLSNELMIQRFEGKTQENINQKALISESGYLYIRFIINNPSENRDYLVSVSRLEEASVIYLGLDSLVEKEIGSLVSRSNREFPKGVRNFAEIQLKENSIDTIYAKVNMNVNSINAETFTFDIRTKSSFENERGSILPILLIGALFILSIFNLIIFLTFKYNAYLLYFTVSFSGALLWFGFFGYSSIYLYPDSQFLLKWDYWLLPLVAQIALGAFIQHYLNTKTKSPFWYWSINVSLILSAIVTLIPIFFSTSFETIELYLTCTAILVFMSFFGASSSQLLNKKIETTYYIYGNIIFCLSAFYFFLSIMGLIPFTSLTLIIMPIGGVIENLLFSTALGFEIKELVLKNRMQQEDIDSFKKESDSYYFTQTAVQVKFKDIIMLESSNNYVKVYIVDRKNPLLERVKMIELVEEFPSSIFIKAHRSYYVNINQIASRPSKYLIKMSNDVAVNVSRSYVVNLGDKFL